MLKNCMYLLMKNHPPTSPSLRVAWSLKVLQFAVPTIEKEAQIFSRNVSSPAGLCGVG